MGKDEDAALDLLHKNRKIQKYEIRKCHGSFVKEMGDGILASFKSVSEAVKCAVEIQQEAKIEGIPIRIGIHEGEVVVDGNDILGDTVNIASRIESFSNVGGILISDAVRNQIRQQQQWDIIPLGKFHLKNINHPIELSAISTQGISVPDADYLLGKGNQISNFGLDFPKSYNPLLGRNSEISKISQLLSKHNIVTITGTGGIGKTRLAIAMCNILRSEFADGIAFISLATIAKTTEVIPTLAETLDVKEASNRSLLDGIADLISNRKALIVLDNLEHVLSAAKEISELSSKCPNLKIINTSRSPLKISAEREFVLRPLGLPEKDDPVNINDLGNYSAIGLFIERAKKANLKFEITRENALDVVKICQRLDGLPLAIELAAARVKLLPPNKIVSLLNNALDILSTKALDVPIRHQTLRSAIDWSYSLLNHSEQILFRRIGCFSGGFTFDAMKTICYNEDQPDSLALDEIESLIEKGLVENIDNGERFNMLQTIIDFAKEKLNDAKETHSIKKKHAYYFAKVTKAIKKGIEGREQISLMKKGINEDSNLQTAFEYLITMAKQNDSMAREIGLNMSGDLLLFWHIRGKHISAKEVIYEFLSIFDHKPFSLGHSRALTTASLASWALGQYELAVKEAKKSRSIAKKLKSEVEIAESSLMLGLAALSIDSNLAAKHLNQGEKICRKLGSIDIILGFTLWVQSLIYSMYQEDEKAKNKLNEALKIQLDMGDKEGGGCTLSGLAKLKINEGDLLQAIELYQKALMSFKEVGDRPEEARVLSEMAWTFLKLNNVPAARKCIFNSILAHQKVGSKKGIGYAMMGLAAVEALEQHPETAMQIAQSSKNYSSGEGIIYEYGNDFSFNDYTNRAISMLTPEQVELAKEVGENLSISDVLTISQGYTTPLLH
jgi:predicted ATPase